MVELAAVPLRGTRRVELHPPAAMLAHHASNGSTPAGFTSGSVSRSRSVIRSSVNSAHSAVSHCEAIREQDGGRNNEHGGIHPPAASPEAPGGERRARFPKQSLEPFCHWASCRALRVFRTKPFSRGRFLFQSRASRGFRHYRVSGGSNLVRKPRSRPAPTRIGTAGIPFGMWLHTGGVAGRLRPHPQLRPAESACCDTAPANVWGRVARPHTSGGTQRSTMA